MNMQFNILSEQEMQWVQFKAKQMLLQLKEDKEWSDFCKEKDFTQIYDQEDIYARDKVSAPVSKDVGIQVQQPKPTHSAISFGTSKLSKPNATVYHQDLHLIKQQLDSIQINLIEIKQRNKQVNQKNTTKGTYRIVDENAQEDLLNTTYSIRKTESSKQSQKTDNYHKEKNRKQFLKSSLKASLLKMQKSSEKLENAFTTEVKHKSVGFVLPHVLREERALARRLSLLPPSKIRSATKLTKRKPINQPPTVNIRSSTKKLASAKPTSIPQNDVILEDERDSEDENVGKVVDEILDDFLCETVSALGNAENLKKKHNVNELSILAQKINDIEHEETVIRQKWGTLSLQHFGNVPYKPTPDMSALSTVISKPRNIDNQNNFGHIDQHIRSVKYFEDIFQSNLEQKADLELVATTNLNKVNNSSIVDKDTVRNAGNPSELDIIPNDNTAIEQSSLISRTDGKEILLYISPEKLRSIYHFKDNFEAYLERTSHAQEGEFYPWAITNRMADFLLDDCIQDIAEEIREIPSSLVVDLYNQEFVHSA